MTIDSMRFRRLFCLKEDLVPRCCYRGRVPTTQSDLTTETDSPIGLTDLGRVRVLRALAGHQQLSRSEIVSRTGLARATVGSIIYELVNGNLVRESATADAGTRTGRPAQVLCLVPDCAYALGLDIAHDHVRAVLTDV